jgi:1-deoxy-D-xylulose-5-phosphate reductoisomerase
MMEKKKVVLLGATGSIGESTLQVIQKNPDSIELVGIACHSSYETLADIARRFGVKHAAIFDEEACRQARASGLFLPDTSFYSGLAGLCDLARLDQANMLLSAVVGTLGLHPTLAAIETGKDIALASKEILVLAGKFITEAARRHGCRILPVDSEHNAIFQCLQGHAPADIERLILTASGGAFRDWPLDRLSEVTPAEALRHPNWEMGPKITVDCATMANKGLELMEACWLFDVRPKQMEVTIHPQSIVHSLVEFVDGSTLAQLSPPSMTFAIQHALLYPHRKRGVHQSLDFSRLMQLEFRPVETDRYPCLQLARHAMEAGGIAPAIFNAANEIAVEAFLANRLPYLEIASVIRSTLEQLDAAEPATLEEILEADASARRQARLLVTAHA